MMHPPKVIIRTCGWLKREFGDAPILREACKWMAIPELPPQR